jgi:xylan 1,4-beta-xylosidase
MSMRHSAGRPNTWFLAAAMAVLTLGAAPVASPPATAPSGPRDISVDLNAVRGPRSLVYKQCVGAGRVGEGLRAEWQAQLKVCRDEIGFEQLRCHGLFHDELGVYREDPAGQPIYNWQYVDQVYDYLLSIGVRPFVELGFMPEALASIPSDRAGPDGMGTDPAHPDQPRRITVFHWRANVTPPKDVGKWAALVRAIVQHWTDRYGTDEVKRWRFEVWNEPNHPAFFSPVDEAHRADEYLALYAATATAVTSVNPAYQVGGPAAAGPAYVGQLIDFAARNKLPLDFISFHAYGLAGGAGGLDELGHRQLYLKPAADGVSAAANSQNAVIARSAKPHLPVDLTEWSTSYSARDPVHDDYISAPYILEQLRNTEALASMSYWTFTDIFEETGIPPRPFHGGFGLINLQGIRKSSYFAYQFLNRLGDRELTNADPHSWVARDPAGGAQALFWDLTFPVGPRQPNNVVFTRVRPPGGARPVRLNLTGLKPGTYVATVYRIGFEKNDAYTAYLKMGAPTDLSPAQVADLNRLAAGRPESREPVTVAADGQWERAFPMRENDVVLATLEPAAAN